MLNSYEVANEKALPKNESMHVDMAASHVGFYILFSLRGIVFRASCCGLTLKTGADRIA
jgi:hypothetical protein